MQAQKKSIEISVGNSKYSSAFIFQEFEENKEAPEEDRKENFEDFLFEKNGALSPMILDLLDEPENQSGF